MRLLKRLGYIVSGFTDASVAIEKLRGDPSGFDVVVSDYNMPTLSGLDVARRVRDIRPDLPVAIVSGYINDRLFTHAEAAGVRELILKTIEVSDICGSIQRFVNQKGHALVLRTPLAAKELQHAQGSGEGVRAAAT